MTGRIIFLYLLGVAALVGTAVPACAQMESREGIALQNQILELRRDLQDLQTQVGSGAAPAPRPRPEAVPNRAPNDLLASLLDRTSRLEDQVRELQGRMDETANRLQRLNDDLTKQIGDLNFQIQNLANGGGARAPAAPGGGSLAPPPSAPPADVPAAPRTPELSLQAGNAALARRDYATAEASAREVLASRSPRTYDAQFLLAQALAGKRDFQQAALAYDDAYNRARTGPHAQDALVGLASSLAAIGEKPAACQTLVKLRSEFPQPRADIREAVGALRQRSGCS